MTPTPTAILMCLFFLCVRRCSINGLCRARKLPSWQCLTTVERIVGVMSRPCLQHSPGDPQSNLRRAQQARRVAELVGEHDLQKQYLVVAGDLNDTPNSKPLKPLLSKKGLFNVNLKLPPADRFTYRSPKEQIDYLLISEALKARLTSVQV